MLVGEHAIQHEKFLAAAVDVPVEIRRGGIADDTGGACHFRANTIEQVALYTG